MEKKGFRAPANVKPRREESGKRNRIIFREGKKRRSGLERGKKVLQLQKRARSLGLEGMQGGRRDHMEEGKGASNSGKQCAQRCPDRGERKCGINQGKREKYSPSS